MRTLRDDVIESHKLTHHVDSRIRLKGDLVACVHHQYESSPVITVFTDDADIDAGENAVFSVINTGLIVQEYHHSLGRRIGDIIKELGELLDSPSEYDP